MRRILMGVIAAAVTVAVLISLVYMTLTEDKEKPKPVKPLVINNNQKEKLDTNQPFSVVTYNIGYGGLDKNQDFFMDGGTMSRSRSKQQTQINLENIRDFLIKEHPSIILLQEVDIDATRSYFINQYEFFRKELMPYSSVFGMNYDVAWVPIPISRPMGSVYSGLVTFSSFHTSSSRRFQFPGEEDWPRRLFDLDRCFIENRVPITTGKDLVVINTHLSAYDEEGHLRIQQLQFLKRYIIDQYRQGHYVIVGGDWNYILPATDPKMFEAKEDWPFWLLELPNDFTPQGFIWAVDPDIPTVRTNAAPYREGINFTAVIDGFLVSPNVAILGTHGHDLGFEHSDHNPVTGVFVLKR